MICEYKKSNFVIFSRKKFYNKDTIQIKIDSADLPQVSTIKFLGVFIDDKLS